MNSVFDLVHHASLCKTAPWRQHVKCGVSIVYDLSTSEQRVVSSLQNNVVQVNVGSHSVPLVNIKIWLINFHQISKNKCRLFTSGATTCGGTLGRCDSAANCNFQFQWNHTQGNDHIEFVMSAAIGPDMWMAIGLSDDQNMVRFIHPYQNMVRFLFPENRHRCDALISSCSNNISRPCNVDLLSIMVFISFIMHWSMRNFTFNSERLTQVFINSS